MPCSRIALIAGVMMASSSVPITPPSPAWGLSASTAMRGALIPKSCLSEALKMASFSWMSSWVSTEDIFATGTCPVTSATRKVSLASIIKALAPSPTLCSMYSVCPGKAKFSDCIICLLMGAVTRTSYSPSLYSFMARSRASKAAFPDSREGLPNSTLTSSSQQLITFSRPCTTSDAEFIMVNEVSISSALR